MTTSHSNDDRLEWILFGIALGNDKSHEHILPSDFTNLSIRSMFVSLVLSRRKKKKSESIRAFFMHFASRLVGFNIDRSDRAVAMDLCRTISHNTRVAERTRSINNMLAFVGNNDNDLAKLTGMVTEIKSFVANQEEMIDAQIATKAEKPKETDPPES